MLLDDPEVGSILIYGMLVTAVLGGLVAALRALGRQMANEDMGGEA